ncbi:hypothetical protein J7L18_08660 [Candidatus Bathyarchaeota archaeon]|nr:hypothetical protein [Candidatus Bathyarchaeota archaeon]
MRSGKLDRLKERYYGAREDTRKVYRRFEKALLELAEKRKEEKVALDDIVRELSRLIVTDMLPCLIREAWAAKNYIEELEKGV